MLYRMVHTINEWYALTLFWMYLAVFLLACALVFVFPLGPILLLFAGLASLGFAILGGKALQRVELGLARHALTLGRCPNCQSPVDRLSPSIDSYRCEHCQALIQTQRGSTTSAQAEGPEHSSGPSRRTQ